MKILHTSDWHLGKKLGTFSRLPEQESVLKEICQITEKENINAIIIAGDIFDSFNPGTDAVELFYRTIRDLCNNGQRAIIVIAGNHDSPDRIEAPDPLARIQGIFFAGYPSSVIPVTDNKNGVSVLQSDEGFAEFKHPSWDAPLRLLLTPYANEFRLKSMLHPEDKDQAMRDLLEKKWAKLSEKYLDKKGVNILSAHLFFMKKGDPMPLEPEEGEKPILHPGGVSEIYTSSIPESVQYTALGHLHRFQNTDTNICYCGSPLAYSFSEAMQEKFVNIVTIKPGEEAITTKHPLKEGRKLIRKKCNGIDEAVEWLEANPDVLVELCVRSEQYLTSDDRKRLAAAHDGIIQLIPDVQILGEEQEKQTDIDSSSDRNSLFIKYFRSMTQQEPNKEILDLFTEIIAKEL